MASYAFGTNVSCGEKSCSGKMICYSGGRGAKCSICDFSDPDFNPEPPKSW